MYVYVLYSRQFEKIYIGYTSNLDERLKSHNELATKGWTIKFRPWVIIHQKIFDNKYNAMKRENQLKTAERREWIWEKISSL